MGNNMIKHIKEWLFGEPLVQIKHGSFFVTTFDPKTQSFKNIDHKGKEIGLSKKHENPAQPTI